MSEKEREGPVAYISVAKEARFEQVIKRSRFIAQVFPVQDEVSLENALQAVQTTYADATHVCYAFRCGLVNELMRFNDAGEPGGTAGRPILEVIEREGLRNTLVTVTRYYGGMKLGAAGLVRAYSSSAAAGVAAAGRATYMLHEEYQMKIEYPDWGRVERLLEEVGARMADVQYGAAVSARIFVPLSVSEALLNRLRDASGGSIQYHLEGEKYYPVAH